MRGADGRRERLAALFERWAEHLGLHGVRLDPGVLCGDEPDLEPELKTLVQRFEQLNQTLDFGGPTALARGSAVEDELPRFEGFRTIERLGHGGGGTVFKLQDLQLGRVVAAKVLRPENELGSTTRDFLREAASMALFHDPRIVTIHEYRPDEKRPVIIMEHVEGFCLDEIAPSLDPRQRARVMAEVCEAVQVAHDHGLTHRDLKPSNIMLDARLHPRLLDFGLADQDPTRGHLRGTAYYIAPEQLDPAMPIDARTDVYALGVVLYELLCGVRPYKQTDQARLLDAIVEGRPRLPVEIDGSVPEPLQAIALKAMELQPDDRYASAREMARELRAYVDGRPVLARPTLYGEALGRRVRPHLDQIQGWLRLKLIYPHEADSLRAAYDHLENREDDWIVASRTLAMSQVTLYLGAFVAVFGSVLLFWTHAVEEAMSAAASLAVITPVAVGLALLAVLLHRRRQEASGVAYGLAGLLLLPTCFLIAIKATGWFADADSSRALLDTAASNRELQLCFLIPLAFAFERALETKTTAMASCAAFLSLCLGVALLSDLGLREWIQAGNYDRIGVALAPLVVVFAVLGLWLEHARRGWFATPYQVGTALLMLIALELIALDGMLMEHLGVSLEALAPGGSDDELLTWTGMALVGLVLTALASLLEEKGTDIQRRVASMFLVIAPFITLGPLLRMSGEDEYGARVDWLLLMGALSCAIFSHFRQRRAFFLAGLSYGGCALWLLTDHGSWFDDPFWPAFVILAGALLLFGGRAIDTLERKIGRPGEGDPVPVARSSRLDPA